MRALLFVALLIALLWGGAAVEELRAPEPVQPTLSVQEEEVVVPEEVESESEPEEEEPTTEVAVETPNATPLVGAVAQAPAKADDAEYTEQYVAELEQAIHALINVERVREGLDVLEYDEDLATVAAGHSTDMAKEDYFAHEDEKGCKVGCRLDRAGYRWKLAGENLFMLRREEHFTVDAAATIFVVGWMNSEGHRKNILHKNFTHEGLGVVAIGNTLYATEVLAVPR